MKNKAKYIVYCFTVLAGLALAAFGVVAFVLPHSIVIGSATGIGRLLEHFYRLPVSATVGAVNIALFLLGLFALGKKFAATIVIGTFAYPLFMRIFEGMEPIKHITDDPLIAALYGGAVVGMGMGLVIKAGASTGGTDVIAIVLNRKAGIPVGAVIYAVDFAILLSQVFIAQSLNEILLGVITTVLYSFMVDKVVVSGESAVQFMIISGKYGQIRSRLQEMVIGTTVLRGESGYREKKIDVLLCVVSGREVKRVQDAVLNIDPEAFLIVESVKEVNGRGYTFDVGAAKEIRKTNMRNIRASSPVSYKHGKK